MRSLSLLGLLAVSACTMSDTDPLYSVFPNDKLELGPIAWDDTVSPWRSIGIVNETYFSIQLDNVTLEGDGADFIELAGVPVDGTPVPVRSSVAIRARVRPPATTGTSQWTTTDYDVLLKFDLSGTGQTDDATGEPDPTALVTFTEERRLTFRLLCDLDGDGYDAEACSGGTDCDDELERVSPDAEEVCDEIDNDCDGRVDEFCDEM